MAALLAFLSSITWGTGDFFGGLIARRRSAIASVLMMQVFGLVTVVIWATLSGAWATGDYVIPGVLAGLTGTAGLMAFYRALATGTMGIVAPIAALGVIVPLLYGLSLGDEPKTVQWLGILLAIVGVILASGPELGGEASAKPLLFAGLAAVLFGVAMALMALGAASSPTMTVVTMRVVQMIVAVVFWVRWRGFGGITKSDLPMSAATGVFDVSANIMYSIAASLGPVSLVAVLGSFPPVATAVLGRFFLHERLTPVQYVGVLSAVAGAVAIGVG